MKGRLKDTGKRNAPVFFVDRPHPSPQTLGEGDDGKPVRDKYMEHEMHLLPAPFEAMKSGSKIIEIRLNDEKRQKVKVGDTIIFHKLPEGREILNVMVLELLHYKDFKSLYQEVPFHKLGCSGKTMEWMLENTYKIYTQEQEEKYGALGIRVELIK